MVLNPALPTGQLCLLLDPALGLGVDIGLNGHNLAAGRRGQHDAREEKVEEKRPHVTAAKG